MNSAIKWLISAPVFLAGGVYTLIHFTIPGDPDGPMKISPFREKDAGLVRASLARTSASARPAMHSGDTQSTMSKLTPDEAARLIKEFSEKTSNISERSIFCAKIIGQLCRNGYTNEAWDMIEPNYGRVRNSQLTTFFIQADMSDAGLLEKLPLMDFPSDRSCSFSGFAMRFAPHELEQMLGSPAYTGLREALGDRGARSLNVSSAISCRLQMAIAEKSEGNPADILTIAADLNARGFLNANDLMIVGSAEAIGNSFEKWSILKTAAPVSGWSGDAKSKRNELICEMIGEDGGRAMDEILASKGKDRLGDLDVGLAAWTQIDPMGASGWYQANRGKLDNEESDQVAKTFSSESVRSLEFDGARRWAAEIKDQGLQAGIIKHIDEKFTETTNARISP